MSLFALIEIGKDYQQWFAFEGQEGLDASQRGKWTQLLFWLDHAQREMVHKTPELVKVKQVTLEWAPVARTILFVSNSSNNSNIINRGNGGATASSSTTYASAAYA